MSLPKMCKGSVTFKPWKPLDFVPTLLSHQFSGGFGYECADDLSTCSVSGQAKWSGSLKIPACSFCPSILSASASVRLIGTPVPCCSGDFFALTTSVPFTANLLGIVSANLDVSFYSNFDGGDEDKCESSRPNYIQNAPRVLVVKGSVKLCFFFCFDIASGDIIKVPGPRIDGLGKPCSAGSDCEKTEFCNGDGGGGGLCAPKQSTGKEVGLFAGEKCLSGIEQLGYCKECNSHGHHENCGNDGYCEFSQCHKKKSVGSHVGWTAGWKCKSGSEWNGYCSECTSSSQCGGGKYCEWGKCHHKRGVGHDVGLTAGWKCHSGIEAWGKCVECNSRGYHARCGGSRYCEWDRCHNKKHRGQHVGWTAGWKCHSGRESWGNCQ